MKYNKLVRDKIPEIINNKGKIPVTHIADDEEYWEKLKNKLKEEVDEFLEEDNEQELSDILEVLYAIYEFKGIDRDTLELIRKKKQEEKGGFKNKIILDEVR